MSENTVGNNTNTVTSWGRKSPRGNKSTRRLFVLITVCLLLGGVAYVVYSTNKTDKKISDQCSSDQQEPLTKEIYVILQKDNKLELKPYVEKIQAIPGYENDATCLYPIVIYQINRGDPAAAKEALDKLKLAYLPKVGYDPTYGPDTKTPNELDKIVSSMLEEQARSANQFDYLSKDQNNE